MKHYYVNINALPNGIHEIHTEGCTYLPTERKYLGHYDTCEEGVKKANEAYEKTNGCSVCMPQCHEKNLA